MRGRAAADGQELWQLQPDGAVRSGLEGLRRQRLTQAGLRPSERVDPPNSPTKIFHLVQTPGKK